MKRLIYFLFLGIMAGLFWACETLQEEDPTPDKG